MQNLQSFGVHILRVQALQEEPALEATRWSITHDLGEFFEVLVHFTRLPLIESALDGAWESTYLSASQARRRALPMRGVPALVLTRAGPLTLSRQRQIFIAARRKRSARSNITDYAFMVGSLLVTIHVGICSFETSSKRGRYATYLLAGAHVHVAAVSVFPLRMEGP